MATIRPRKKKGTDGRITTVFHVQIRMNGFPSRTGTFPTERMAKRWATTIEAEMIEGRHFKSGAGRRRTMTEAAVKYAREVLRIDAMPEFEATLDYEKKLEAFLARKWVQPTHPDAPADARNSVARLMWWCKELRGYKVAAVTTELIEEKLSKLRTEPFQRSKPHKKNSIVHGQAPRLMYRTEKTVNRYIAAGSRLFRIAYKRWHWITSNPFSGIERAGEKGGRLKVLTEDERMRIFLEIRQDYTLHAFSITALAAVVRAGDLQKLRKEDVEFFQVKDTKSQKCERFARLAIRLPKNQEPRIVTITGPAVDVLNAHIKLGDPSEPRVFVSQTGKLYRYHEQFVEACKRAGITGFTFHGFRHSGATYLARLGATEQQLKAIGGWKSNVVSKYVHLAAEDAKAVVEKMNNNLLGAKS